MAQTEILYSDEKEKRVFINDFSLIAITSLVSIGLLSAFLQCTLTILLFAKHGAVFYSDQNSYSFAFLSDALRTDSVLANAWTLSFIPSLTIIVCVLTSYFWINQRFRLWACMQVAVTCFGSALTHFGLLLIIFFDNKKHNFHHCVGVAAAVGGFLIMHILIIHSDWEILRRTWHPSILIDSILIILALVSVIMFAATASLHDKTGMQICVLSEWVLLVILISLQLNLPARAVRIALYVTESNTSVGKSV